MITIIKNTIRNELQEEVKNLFNLDEDIVIERPRKKELGDLSIPVFSISKKLKRNPNDIANELKKRILSSDIKSYIFNVSTISGFINIKLNRTRLSKKVIDMFLDDYNYGSSDIGKNKTICIDYSSPNIAKPFSIGHLRSTVIGNALGNICEKCGYKVVRINHLGDFGTQFGKVIYAYQTWGDKEKIKENPIEELSKLYVKFNTEVKLHPELMDEARKIFKELENGNVEYMKLWKYIRSESLKEHTNIYNRLNIFFDSYNGESFYNNKVSGVINLLDDKNLLTEDDGAMVVNLDGFNNPALIKKSDGSALYITRDLAALFYRKYMYDFDEMLYVVGSEQKLHFEQLKAIVKSIPYRFYQDIKHINFGLVLQNGKKMASQEGNTIKLENVLNGTVSSLLKTITEKNPKLDDKESIAEAIGVSAVIFNDLKNYRENNFEFNLNEITNFSGRTGPYLQYTSVRIKSILDEVDYIDKLNYKLFKNDHYFDIIKHVDTYQEIIEQSKEEYSPSILAQYLLDLATLYNTFYSKEKILVDDLKEKSSKLLISKMTYNVLIDGMRLLGMFIVDNM